MQNTAYLQKTNKEKAINRHIGKMFSKESRVIELQVTPKTSDDS